MDALRLRLNQETARVRWVELSRHFAAGRAYRVRAGLDLIEVAAAIAEDDSTRVAAWAAAHAIAPVSDREARRWQEHDALLWAVVVKPYVLIQESASD